MMEEVRRTFLGDWTYLKNHPGVIDTVRKELTRNIDRILSVGLIVDETQHALEQELGACENWTAAPLFATLLRCISMINGRVFVGLPLCREEDWIEVSIGYTKNVVDTFDAARKWNTLLRPLVAPFLSSVRRCRKMQRRMRGWMKPLLAEVLSRKIDKNVGQHSFGMGMGKEYIDLEARGTFISWLMNHLPMELRNAEQLSISQIIIAFGTIYTVSSTLAMILFDLACRPEYIKILREEIEEVERQNGICQNKSGAYVWTKRSISKLWKLDSFMKESQRVSPLSISK